MKPNKVLLGCAALMAALTASTADAKTLRWARVGDSLTLDPHAQNEGPTHAMSHQIYEPLIIRDMTGALTPTLATSWAPSDADPNVWVFRLREGVTFQDGAAFTADDVVFSLRRAMAPTSAMKELLSSVKDVVKVDDHTVNIVTDGPNPILPANLTNLFVMDEGWATEHKVTEPQNYAGGEETYAVRHANGTGPYKLISRAPDSLTELELNNDYWGRNDFQLDVTKIVFTPIQNPATRVAALLSGEVDFIQDVPVQDIQRVGGTPGLVVGTAPQNRTIFFGLNVGDADLTSDNIAGKNPLADHRVREAMNIAINRDAIKTVVMRGQSQPTGVIMPPFVNGWTSELDAYPAPDVARARALLAEAGYADGFSLRLDCPNDRYINDEAICQAAVGMLGQIGVKVTLQARPKAQHFPLIQKLESDFYMLGWGVPTYDSEYVFNFLVHTRDKDFGSWNATRFSDAQLDAKILALSSETDLEARNASIADIWKAVQANMIYIPIHHQVLNWGFTSKINTPVDPEDSPKFKYIEFAD